MTVTEITRSLKQENPAEDVVEQMRLDRRVAVRRLAEKLLRRRRAESGEFARLDKMLEYEREARRQGYTRIAGVDEAGKGPLAGPVVAAAVILPENTYIIGLNDSKLLTPQKRETLYAEITARALAWSVGVGEVTDIETLNILNAGKLAMIRALATLSLQPDFIITDALQLDGIDCPQQPLVGGDRLSLSVAAASVLAKVTRDRWMTEMAKVFPGYGFAANKGYATREHREAIRRLGPCPMHRRSFLLLPELYDE
jgi:ribonuclease HII